MPYLFQRIFFLIATLFLCINITFAQKPLVDRTSDYIITKRLLSVENGLSGSAVNSAVQDNEGFMWFGTENGLSRFDGKNFINYSKEKDGLSGNSIIQVLMDDSNRLVIVSDDRENGIPLVCLMDLTTYIVSSAIPKSEYAILNPHLKWKMNSTSDFKFVNNSIVANLINESIEIYSKEELVNLPKINIGSHYLDKYGNNWLCTSSGVFEISYRKKLFVNYFNNEQSTGVFNKQVRNIYTESDFKNENDKSDKIIYACMGTKLFIHKNNNIVTAFTVNGMLYSLLNKSGKIYISGPLLYVLDLQKQQLKVVDTLFDGEIFSLYPASPNTIYTGRSTGIFLYNEMTQKSEKLKALNQSFPNPGLIYRFVQTRQHGLIAVAQNGLFEIKNNIIVDYYGPTAVEPDHQLPIDDIFDMYEDKEGVCWIASKGNGLFRWTWSAADKKYALENFTVESGLPSNILCRIEEDGDNNLWVSTFNGLFSINKKNRLIYSFHTADGIINNEFNRMSSFKGPDGRLYFGTINGLTAFYPDEVLEQATISLVPFHVTMINKYSDAKDDFEPCINEFRSNKRVVIKPGEGMLTVEFSLLDFQDRDYVYLYKIEGMPGKWKLGKGNTLNINSLPYGKFALKIKSQLANGMWNPVEIEIPIVVLKPFYLQLWFIVLGIIALAAVIRWYYSAKTKKLLQRKIMLESLVQKRTNSLSTALHEKDLLIKEVHHRVKNNLQVIISLLHLQNDKITDGNLKAAIVESQSRIGSIALIHQNLYQNDRLDTIRFDEFVINLNKQLDDFYKKPDHQIILETCIKHSTLDIDTAVPLGLILNELFSNTHKHAFKNISPIKVTILLEEISKGAYKLVFHDNGPGLSDEGLFLNAQTLGLELIRGLAKQLHGEAVYQYKEGSEFTIFFKDSITRKSS